MYIVKDILEPDFGCEGLPDGQELCCEVILEDQESGQVLTVKAADAELYEKGIEVGSAVTYKDEKLKKGDKIDVVG